MRASWALFIPSLCVGIHAFGHPPVGGPTQHVLGSVDVSGQSYTCNNGATPSLECVPQSSEANCDCTCSNGIHFNQPLSFGSSGNPIPDGCQAEKEECLLREQQLANDFNLLKESYMRKEEEHKIEMDKLKDSFLLKEQQYLETERDLRNQVATCQSNTWGYEGCYTDSATRVLNGLKTQTDDMTVEKCAAFCTKYKYYGLESHDECYCGNTFEAPTNKVLDRNCDTKCKGSIAMCGGGWHISLYSKKI
ncbi:WSC domain-containing protein [Bipolaris maydis]|nr:WSC domain-containing protein [Bipolaris maydis]KAJ5058484.1 WSC domain-containing protein [Bipolaris maydis]KAJ6195726.1 WSC domain-containing protein [Bipolaris maydis]KAJ6269219.1 WSC domain-containing protein [Bipolaris maydis]KAJ6280033.1 WSC domain-containing protein [Bipolaris maydis]